MLLRALQASIGLMTTLCCDSRYEGQVAPTHNKITLTGDATIPARKDDSSLPVETVELADDVARDSSPGSPPYEETQEITTARGGIGFLDASAKANEEAAAQLQAQLEQFSGKALKKLNPLYWLVGDQTEQTFLEQQPGEEGSLAYLRWSVAHFTVSYGTRLFFVLVIAINAICIGIETDGHGSFDTWMITESLFNVIFAIEVMLKWFGFGLLFWTDNWNIADVVTVI